MMYFKSIRLNILICTNLNNHWSLQIDVSRRIMLKTTFITKTIYRKTNYFLQFLLHLVCFSEIHLLLFNLRKILIMKLNKLFWFKKNQMFFSDGTAIQSGVARCGSAFCSVSSWSLSWLGASRCWRPSTPRPGSTTPRGNLWSCRWPIKSFQKRLLSLWYLECNCCNVVVLLILW